MASNKFINGDRYWSNLTNGWVRIVRVEYDGMVQVSDVDGNVLPDLVHPSQLITWEEKFRSGM